MTMMGVGLGVTPPFFTVILFLQTNPLIEHHPEAFPPSLSSRGLRGTLYCQLGIQGVLYRANDLVFPAGYERGPLQDKQHLNN